MKRRLFVALSLTLLAGCGVSPSMPATGSQTLVSAQSKALPRLHAASFEAGLSAGQRATRSAEQGEDILDNDETSTYDRYSFAVGMEVGRLSTVAGRETPREFSAILEVANWRASSAAGAAKNLESHELLRGKFDGVVAILKLAAEQYNSFGSQRVSIDTAKNLDAYLKRSLEKAVEMLRDSAQAGAPKK